jgi:transposase
VVSLSKQQRKILESVIKSKEKNDEMLRAQAILMLDDVISLKTIVSLTGFKRRHIFFLRKRFLDEGIGSITDKRKGKPKELLSKKQREEIILIVKNKTPKDIGYAHDFWTTSILGDYIKTKYKVSYLPLCDIQRSHFQLPHSS